LGALFSNPGDHLTSSYGWGGEIEHALLMPRVQSLLWTMGVNAKAAAVPPPLVASRFGGDASAAEVDALAMPLLSAAVQQGEVTASGQLDAMLIPVPDTGSAATGLLLTLQAFGEVEHQLQLGDGWNLTSAASIDASGALGLEVQPDGITLPSSMPHGSASLSLLAAPDTPAILVGEDGKTRVVLSRFEAGVEVEVAGNQPSFGLGVDLQGLELIITPGDGDGFLSDVLGGNDFNIPMELGLQWSQSEGLTISGGAGFDVQLQINRSIGPLTIETVGIRFLAGADGAELTAITTGGLVIGPFAASVKDIGFQISLQPVERGARNGKGAVVFTAAFKPPSGLGLSVNAPGVGGGRNAES